MPVASDGTAFLDAFNANLAESASPAAPDVAAPTGEEAQPGDPDTQDRTGAVEVGPTMLWLGAAVGAAPFIPKPSPDQPSIRMPGDPEPPPPVSFDLVTAPLLPRSSGSRDARLPTAPEPEAGPATTGPAQAVVHPEAWLAAGPLQAVLSPSTAQGWISAPVAAAPLQPVVVPATVLTDGGGADPDRALVGARPLPATADHKTAETGVTGPGSGRLMPAPAGGFRPASSPPRPLPATRAISPQAMQTMPETGGGSGAVPPGGPAVAPAAAGAGDHHPGGGLSDPARAAAVMPRRAAPDQTAATGFRPTRPAPALTQAAPDLRAVVSPMRGTVFTRAPFPQPVLRVGRPVSPTPIVPPDPGLATTAPPVAVEPAPMPAASQPAPVVDPALVIWPDHLPAEPPAPILGEVGWSREPMAQDVALKSQEIAQGAATGSGLAQPHPPTNPVIHPDLPETATDRIGAAPTLADTNPDDPPSTRSDTGPETAAALADGSAPARAVDSPAAGASLPPLAQITATPVTAPAMAIGPLPRPLVPALVELARDAGSDAVELSLAPAELGRLRMSLVPDGEAVRVVLSAERPETIDLMRRHGDQLAQEFRQAGFSGATLSFGQWGAGGATYPPPQGDPSAPAAPDPVAMPLPLSPGPAPGPSVVGLDLRL